MVPRDRDALIVDKRTCRTARPVERLTRSRHLLACRQSRHTRVH